LGQWEALGAALQRCEQLQGGRRLESQAVLGAMHLLAKYGYDAATEGGAIQRAAAPTVSQIDQATAGWRALADIHDHHTVPVAQMRQIFEWVKGRAPTAAEMRALDTEMPGLPLYRFWHTLRDASELDGPALVPFHQILDRKLAQLHLDQLATNDERIDALLAALRDTYRDFNASFGGQARCDYNKVWLVAHEWLQDWIVRNRP